MSTLRLLTAALCASAFAAPAAANELHGRLTLDVKVEGSGQAKGLDREHARYATSETLHLSFMLEGNNIPIAHNMNDTSKDNVSAAPAAPPAGMPSPQAQEAYALKMQAQAQACGADIACMQQIAMKMAQEQATWMQPAQPSADEGRYFNYSAAVPCKGAYSLRVRNTVEGIVEDTTPRPFTEISTADVKVDERTSSMFCAGGVTIDSRNDGLWVRVEAPGGKGHYKYTDNGKVVIDSSTSDTQINADAWKWVLAQLKGAPRSGVKRTTLVLPIDKARGGKGQHRLNVEMRWAFVET